MRKTWLVLCSVFQIAIYLRALMDAVLKHLGLRSDFIVCHPDMIDDPLFHARRPPSLPQHTYTHTHTHTHTVPCCMLHSLHTANSKHLQHLFGSRSMELIFLSLSLQFLHRALLHDDKFSFACIPGHAVHLFCWSFPILLSKIPSLMPFFQNFLPPNICLGALHVLFVPVANTAPAIPKMKT